jgi:hypothetical protein
MPHEIFKENDNVYLNISFIGNPGSSGNIPLEYNVTKNTPLLDDASQYYATVVKFDIPLLLVPLTIFPVQPNQADPNLSTLQIGIRYNGVNYLQYLEYQTLNNFTTPIQNQPTQNINPYYYIYSYDHMIAMINTALLTAYTASGILALLPTVTPPYYSYDANTKLIKLIVPNAFVSQSGSLVGIPQIIVNYSLLQYLDGWTYKDISVLPPFSLFAVQLSGIATSVPNPLGMSPIATLFQASTLNGQSLSTGSATPDYYTISQDYSTVQLWSSLRKLLFVTNTIPISFEYVPSNNNVSNNDGLNASIPIITDFTPMIEDPKDIRSIAYYQPGGWGNYRLIDMISSKTLNSIDIKVYWQDIANNLHPLSIPAYSQANIKLGFIRKTLYKGSRDIIY